MSNFNIFQQRDKEAIANTYGRFPVCIASGHGATCADYDGKTYIDFSSGIGVNAFGFCDKGWIDAVTWQLNTLQHTSNLYYTEPCINVAERLKALTGMARVFFANSGAEANEGAIKAARKYSVKKYGKERTNIVTLKNSFHGRTVTTLAATGQDVFHKDFYPFTEGFLYARANDLEDTLAKMEQNACAVMLECIQGEGGVLPLEQEYLTAVQNACHKKDILLIVDEVQTGAGRTGTFLCSQQFGLTPDLVTMAKGIGGGLPLGAVLFAEKVKEVLVPGDHASTFGGNPVICAGAQYILSQMTDELFAEVKKKGDHFRKALCAMPHVTGTSGLGLMIGISLEGVTSKQVVNKALENGVLTLTAKEKLRLLPPLNISQEEIDKGLEHLEQTLRSF